MPFFQVRQRVSPFYQYRLRSAIKVIVAIETIILRLPHPACLIYFAKIDNAASVNFFLYFTISLLDSEFSVYSCPLMYKVLI